jgi:hypothetical protein
MGYKVVENMLLPETSVKNCPVYDVIERKAETKEEVFIRRFRSRDEAKALSKHLNLGGGFDGWTPNFFVVNPQNRGS